MKLSEWTQLRTRTTSDMVGPDFYRVLHPAPIESITGVFKDADTSTAGKQ